MCAGSIPAEGTQYLMLIGFTHLKNGLSDMPEKKEEPPKSTKRRRFASEEEAKEALLKRLEKRPRVPPDHPIFSKGFLIGGVIIAGRSKKVEPKESSEEPSSDKQE